MAKILDGRALAKEIRAEVAVGVGEMQQKHEVTPGLAAVLVGDDPASAIYVRNKRRACADVAMYNETFLLPASSRVKRQVALHKGLIFSRPPPRFRSSPLFP